VTAPVGVPVALSATWNISGAIGAERRGKQQLAEAACEDIRNYTPGDKLKAYAGLLPFGTEADDPHEPYWIDVFAGKVQNAWRHPATFIQELGTLGL
jgi:hypothetical protein